MWGLWFYGLGFRTPMHVRPQNPLSLLYFNWILKGLELDISAHLAEEKIERRIKAV